MAVVKVLGLVTFCVAIFGLIWAFRWFLLERAKHLDALDRMARTLRKMEAERQYAREQQAAHWTRQRERRAATIDRLKSSPLLSVPQIGPLPRGDGDALQR